MTKRILKVLAVLAVPAMLSGPSQAQSIYAGSWTVISCNTDGTYTCARENCMSACCDKYIYPT